MLKQNNINNLIISPMIQQMDIVLKGLKIKKSETNTQIIKKNNVFCSVGVGSLNSSFKLNQLIIKYSPKNVIIVGCAGGITQNLKIGQVLQSYNFYNLDCMNQQFDYKGPSLLPAKEICSCLYNQDKKLNYASCISTDNFVNSSKRRVKIKKYILKKYNLFKDTKIFVDMQSFACAFVCEKFNINFIALRQISDIAGENSSENINSWFKKQHKQLIKSLKNIIYYSGR